MGEGGREGRKKGGKEIYERVWGVPLNWTYGTNLLKDVDSLRLGLTYVSNVNTIVGTLWRGS